MDEIEIQGENLIIFMLFVNKEKLIEFYNCKLMSDICLVRGIERERDIERARKEVERMILLS